MPGLISTDYRELLPEEVPAIAALHDKAWQDDALPMRQYETVLQEELGNLDSGNINVAFAAFVRCVNAMKPFVNRPKILDVGASSGHYKRLLDVIKFEHHYKACDYSAAFREFAKGLWPDIDFDVADARALPYRDGQFDIVMTGGMLMHIYEWQSVIAELARVSSRYVILHRTPIVDGFLQRDTRYFEKKAYGVPCLEVHFSEQMLLLVCAHHGLDLVYATNIDNTNHKSYLFEQPDSLNHIQV